MRLFVLVGCFIALSQVASSQDKKTIGFKGDGPPTIPPKLGARRGLFGEYKGKAAYGHDGGYSNAGGYKKTGSLDDKGDGWQKEPQPPEGPYQTRGPPPYNGPWHEHGPYGWSAQQGSGAQVPHYIHVPTSSNKLQNAVQNHSTPIISTNRQGSVAHTSASGLNAGGSGGTTQVAVPTGDISASSVAAQAATSNYTKEESKKEQNSQQETETQQKTTNSTGLLGSSTESVTSARKSENRSANEESTKESGSTSSSQMSGMYVNVKSRRKRSLQPTVYHYISQPSRPRFTYVLIPQKLPPEPEPEPETEPEPVIESHELIDTHDESHTSEEEHEHEHEHVHEGIEELDYYDSGVSNNGGIEPAWEGSNSGGAPRQGYVINNHNHIHHNGLHRHNHNKHHEHHREETEVEETHNYLDYSENRGTHIGLDELLNPVANDGNLVFNTAVQQVTYLDNNNIKHSLIETSTTERLDLVQLGTNELGQETWGIPVHDQSGTFVSYIHAGTGIGNINFKAETAENGHVDWVYNAIDSQGVSHNVHLNTENNHLVLVETEYNGVQTMGVMGHDSSGEVFVPVHFEKDHLVVENTAQVFNYALVEDILIFK